MAMCPDHQELIAFAKGQLEDSRLDEIATHLSDCPSCESALSSVADDTLATFLRKREEVAPLLRDASLAQLEERVCRALNTEMVNASPTVSLLAEGRRRDIPDRLGQYALIAPLGRGGMGIVYKAIHTRLNKIVALKVLSPARAFDPLALQRFEREMTLIGRLDDAHIVRALDANTVDGVSYLVMEYIDGADLGQILQQRRVLSIADACEVAAQAAEGLQHIARQGLVHRDIKPSNLLLSSAGVAKIADLGLSRLQEDTSSLDMTSEHHVLGTIDYLAPEQAADPRSVDVRADIYSLGCTLYRALAGRAPFATDAHQTHEAKLKAHARQTPATLRSLDNSIPDAVSQLVAEMLAKRPEDRPALEQIHATLRRFTAGSDLAAVVAHAQLNQPPTVASHAPALAPGRKRVATGLPIKLIGAGLLTVIVAASLAPFLINADVPDNQPAPNALPITVKEETRDLAALEPLRWHLLLDRPPRAALWPASQGLSVIDFDPAKEQLNVHCNDIGLLEFGSSGKDFVLQASLHQRPWIGGVGLFLNLREEQSLNETVMRCEVIEIDRYDKRRPEKGMQVQRYNLEIRRSADMPPGAERFYVASDRTAVLAGETLLEVIAKDGQVTSISLDGKPLPLLTNADATAKFEPMDASARCGIYAGTSSFIVRNARFQATRPVRWEDPNGPY